MESTASFAVNFRQPWAAINTDRRQVPSGVDDGAPWPTADPATTTPPSPVVVVGECIRCGAGQHASRDGTRIVCTSCASELRSCACEYCKWAACIAAPTLVKAPMCPHCGTAYTFGAWIARPAALGRLAWGPARQYGRPDPGVRRLNGTVLFAAAVPWLAPGTRCTLRFLARHVAVLAQTPNQYAVVANFDYFDVDVFEISALNPITARVPTEVRLAAGTSEVILRPDSFDSETLGRLLAPVRDRVQRRLMRVGAPIEPATRALPAPHLGHPTGGKSARSEYDGQLPKLKPYRCLSSSIGTPSEPGVSVALELVERIVGSEGPVVGDRIYRAYADATNRHPGRDLFAEVDGALSQLIGSGVLKASDPTGTGHPRGTTYHNEEQRPQLRELGPRSLAQVPPEELALLLAEAGIANGWSLRQAYLAAMDHLGGGELTAEAKELFDGVRALAHDIKRRAFGTDER
ncbi:MAG: hypothetical protein JWQ86_3616 [Mycobacterium sp.]|nr:hypothetical protein [Mycobacterium sp.]